MTVDNAFLLPTASPADTRRVILGLLFRQRGLAILAIAVLLFSTALALTVPPILGAITQTVVDDGSVRGIDLLAAALFVVLAVSAALSGWVRVLLARLGETVLAALREQVLDTALRLPLGRVEQAGTGDLASRVGEDADTVSFAIRQAFPELFGSLLMIVLTVAGMAVLDWRLALAGFAAVPVQFFATRWYLRRSGPQYAAERRANSARAQQITESISGADTVRAFGLSAIRIRLSAQSSEVALARSLRANRTGSVFYAYLNMAELVGLSATLAVGFLAVRSGAVSIGEATAGALYFHGLFNPIGSVLGLLDTAQDATASLARLVGVTQLESKSEPQRSAKPLDATVALDKVTFGYVPDVSVVREVDLHIESSDRVAVVGATGAGKTTIAKIVAGIHQPASGAIKIGGRTHDELGTTSATVALVTQEVHVFSGTIADNLRLARPESADADLLEAMNAVGAMPWVEILPDGLDTEVGDGGHLLTAGHAQHLALARLWLSPATIVVLDEATAEAGSSAARTLENAAIAAIRDRTAIVVAHRLTQAVTADSVIVVSRGRIAERGTHAQLVDAGGLYAQLWDAWSSRRHDE